MGLLDESPALRGQKAQMMNVKGGWSYERCLLYRRDGD